MSDDGSVAKDPASRLGYEQARANIAVQNDYLATFRRQSLGAGAVEATLIALIVRPFDEFPPPGQDWILATTFTVFSFFCMGFIVKPHPSWRVTKNIKRILDEGGMTEAQLLRKLARNLSKSYSDNQKIISQFQSVFGFQLVVSIVAVGMWLGV